jgi:hypothetical protein
MMDSQDYTKANEKPFLSYANNEHEHQSSIETKQPSHQFMPIIGNAKTSHVINQPVVCISCIH